jgi:hypothetical protein
MMSNPALDLANLLSGATAFAAEESAHDEPGLFGVTDGKTIGTYLEHKFRDYLAVRFEFGAGNSASGIDFPGLAVDMKVTSAKQPQSSCPFKSAKEKIYGLGYSLLVFVYDKTDDPALNTARLKIAHTIFVDAEYTGDYQTTKGLLDIMDRGGNEDDIVAYLFERNLPLDEVAANQLAAEILLAPPTLGYLTISNALQWRLQYKRVIDLAGTVDGVLRL